MACGGFVTEKRWAAGGGMGDLVPECYADRNKVELR